MAKAMVKCLYCGEMFDRNDPNIKFIKPTQRRYAHLHCAQQHDANMTQEDKDKASLFKYIKDLLGSDYDYKKVEKQVAKYKNEENYTYSGMEKTLRYFYDVKGNSTEGANGGVGIIPYIYKEAYQYFYKLHLAQVANHNIINYQPTVKKITIVSPRTTQRPPRLFNIDREEEDGKS